VYINRQGGIALAETLHISERDIRRHGPGNALAICWRQWRTERHLRRRGIHYRATNPERVAAAYAAMSATDFDAINGPQAWANWRTIPRAMNGHVQNLPLRVLDLGCGSGSSTRVLAFYSPDGSHLTGYEFAVPLELARRRHYVHRSGKAAHVDFVCQGVTETLRQPDGAAVPDGSVDLVNASGIVGHHLNPRTIGPLLAELRRLLAPAGIALLDVGPTMPASVLRRLMAEAGFAYLGHYRSWLGDRTGALVFRRLRLSARGPGR
jgi:SAM-dependent methyltransferase